ncbi:hypothetical protein V6Z11_D09G041200 [Gossypium hirsutum]|uniref:Uncharacterized mitochondrial protein AtMg00310-like n=1 Tax=Gossypium hirsutum TaxID=3635 RepID=A0A1U8I4X5_GOSHI|nr:uncharacterized mitochondrial protein AtMg00310-like [Gossypium hirsutum]
MAWDTLCKPKGVGDLRFRDLRLFSIMLLERQDGDVFHPKTVDKPSFAWTSISTAAKALKAGFDWEIRNGRRVTVWLKMWGFEGLDGNTLSDPSVDIQERVV